MLARVGMYACTNVRVCASNNKIVNKAYMYVNDERNYNSLAI